VDAAQARAKSLRERIFLHFSQKAMVEGRAGRLPRRVCQSLTVLYQRNCFFRFVPYAVMWEFRIGRRVPICLLRTDVDQWNRLTLAR